MFTNFSDHSTSLSDLAARLTEPALQILGGAGASGDSVEMELELWHELTSELRQELCEQHNLPQPSTLRQVVRRAAGRVAAERSGYSKYRTHRALRTTDRLVRA